MNFPNVFHLHVVFYQICPPKIDPRFGIQSVVFVCWHDPQWVFPHVLLAWEFRWWCFAHIYDAVGSLIYLGLCRGPTVIGGYRTTLYLSRGLSI